MQIASMMVKGLFMYCFLLTFYNQLLRTDYSLTDTLDRYSPKGLGVGSVVRSLGRKGFMGFLVSSSKVRCVIVLCCMIPYKYKDAAVVVTHARSCIL